MPRHPEKFYLTKEGLGALKKEYEELQKIARSKIGEKVPETFHSEESNPEYIVYREDNELLQARLSDLEYILKNTELIKAPPRGKQKTIDLGATVLVETNGRTEELTIVGTLEANPSLGKISNESPVGRALLGHRAGEEITIFSPLKTIYKIKKLKY
jgi:transcription elongation factor GreA